MTSVPAECGNEAKRSKREVGVTTCNDPDVAEERSLRFNVSEWQEERRRLKSTQVPR